MTSTDEGKQITQQGTSIVYLYYHQNKLHDIIDSKTYLITQREKKISTRTMLYLNHN